MAELNINYKGGVVSFKYDDVHQDIVNSHKWNVNYHKTLNKMYAVNTKKYKRIYLHRLVTNAPKGMVVDHIDGDTTNNMTDNLRICTHAENIRNSCQHIHKTSIYKGIHWDKRRKSYQVCIKYNYKKYRIAQFKDEIEAAACYDNTAKIFFGEYAFLNNVNNETWYR